MARTLSGLLLALLLGACGAGAGSGIPCESTIECPGQEQCVLTTCAATTATCQNLCVTDAECTGGIDSSPSGASCLPTSTESCPERRTSDQEADDSFCVE
ncbi:MAG: hypothetical protein H6744_04740 [Deltaproteobacteria bacterium]|nr:hypothetical protein [Deltaproteobacteria bacterium]